MNETEKAIAARLVKAIQDADSRMIDIQIHTYHEFLKAVELRIGIEQPPTFGMTATGIIEKWQRDAKERESYGIHAPEPGEPHAFVPGELGACTICGKSSLSHEPAPAFVE